MKVLYEETLKIEHFEWSGSVILALILCIIAAAILIMICYNFISDNPTFLTIATIALMAITIFICRSIGCKDNKSYQTLYYLTIDEHTTWKDVNNKFEIIEQKGDLIIAEKKPE